MDILTERNIVYWFQILTLFALFELCFSKDSTATFVFGDSLVDVGNNNYIPSLAKANHVPNGIDFGKPTGRFTNGRTIPDIVGQELGFKTLIPPYLAPSTTGSVILQGVNYASGGAGILNETGKVFVARINMDAQIDNFANTREDIIRMIGLPAALDLLNASLFSTNIGSNDIINNYYSPVFSGSEHGLISPESFVGSVISRFRLQLTRLYDLGARKILVANAGPVGCIPYQRELNLSPGDHCLNASNQMALLFNSQLRNLITELRGRLPNSEFVYADVYRIFEDIIQNYTSYGFEIADSACCSIAGRYGGIIPCRPPSKVCGDRSKYVFWDPYHPSDAANSIIASRLLDGDTDDVWPINIRQLFSS